MNIRGKDKLQQVKSDIEIKIIMGEYQAGERVPSVRGITEIYPIGVSRARLVLEKMCQEKTIILEQGIGYKVSSQAPKMLAKKYQEELYDIFSQACEDAVKIGINPVEMVQGIMENREKTAIHNQSE